MSELSFASFDSFETLQPSDAPRIPLSDFERKVIPPTQHFFFFLIIFSLELSDTQVYEPDIRGTIDF